MVTIGAHMSTGKGFDKAAANAQSIGATAMQVFTRNPRGSKARDLKEKELARLAAIRSEGLKIVCHAPYTINLASSTDEVREFAIGIIAEDLQRIQQLGAIELVVHSGAHTGAGKEKGLERLIQGLETLVPLVPKGHRILLETMSGSGSELGSTIEEMAQVMAHFDYSEQLGICLDTCHLYAAGYDVRNWQGFKAQFTEKIPWRMVGCIHMNDSKTPQGSHKDRHERLGEGTIGWEGFFNIVRTEASTTLPLVMETPNELSGWEAEIAQLRKALI